MSECQVIVFNIKSSSYDLAINAERVKEVIEYSQIDPLPNSYQPYYALINLRGVPVPLLNLSVVFNEEVIPLEDKRIIICEVDNKLIGFESLPSIKMKKLYEDESRSDKSYIKSVLKLDEKFVYLLDLENIIQSTT